MKLRSVFLLAVRFADLVHRAREEAVAAEQDVVIFDDHGDARTTIADEGSVHRPPKKIASGGWTRPPLAEQEVRSPSNVYSASVQRMDPSFPTAVSVRVGVPPLVAGGVTVTT